MSDGEQPTEQDTCDATRAVQQMPGMRCRVNPRHVRDLVCYLLAYRTRFDELARQTVHRMSGRARTVRNGQIAWGRIAGEVVDRLCRALIEDTVSAHEFHAMLEAWQQGLSGPPRLE